MFEILRRIRLNNIEEKEGASHEKILSSMSRT
jgi:hypothetical protein